jgi:hypothetical protein
MYVSHISVTMPKDGEAIARLFYSGQLGLRELPKPEFVQVCGGLWFDVGGLALHLSIEENRGRADTRRHFGLGCGDVDGLKAKLKAAGAEIEDGLGFPGSVSLCMIPSATVSKSMRPGEPHA